MALEDLLLMATRYLEQRVTLLLILVILLLIYLLTTRPRHQELLMPEAGVLSTLLRLKAFLMRQALALVVLEEMRVIALPLVGLAV